MADGRGLEFERDLPGWLRPRRFAGRRRWLDLEKRTDVLGVRVPVFVRLESGLTNGLLLSRGLPKNPFRSVPNSWLLFEQRQMVHGFSL